MEKSNIDALKKLPMWMLVKARIPELKKESGEWKSRCPFHKDDTPSFTVRVNDEGVWLFKCFGCGEAGNVLQFVQKFDKLLFSEAAEKVEAEFARYQQKALVDSTFQTVGDKKEYVTYPTSHLAKMQSALQESPAAIKWLGDRGITLKSALSMGVGFVQSAKAISPSHKYVNDGWIAFPYVQGDQITGIKFRSLVAKKDGILRAPNTATTLYNLPAITSFDDAWMVEGEPDTVVMHQAGYAATGLPSAEYNPTPEERDQLTRANRIFLAGDMDEVGRKGLTKLWREFKDRTYLIEWPDGCKDANDAFQMCGNDVEQFQKLVEHLKQVALQRPMPDFYDVREVLRTSQEGNPMDDPRRLHLRNPEVDTMAITLPGNIVSIFGTFTGTGKTTWCLDNFELHEVIDHGRTVINYSCELSTEEFGRLVTANLMEKDRLHLDPSDWKKAAKKLDSTQGKFYVGYNPDLTRVHQVLDVLEAGIVRLGAHIVVIDHLHFLCRNEKGNEISVQADAMQRIKNMAVKYKVIMVVVGQSRKQPTAAAQRATQMHDAKGSETFISDATTTYHLHRNIRRDIDWAHPENFPDDMLEPVTEVRLYKCRTKGPGKAVALQYFKGSIGKFVPWTSQTQPPLPDEGAGAE